MNLKRPSSEERAKDRTARRNRSQSATETESSLRFSMVNGILAGAGLLTVTLGYYLLAQGSITAAPLLLVLGYVVILPLAIIR